MSPWMSPLKVWPRTQHDCTCLDYSEAVRWALTSRLHPPAPSRTPAFLGYSRQPRPAHQGGELGLGLEEPRENRSGRMLCPCTSASPFLRFPKLMPMTAVIPMITARAVKDNGGRDFTSAVYVSCTMRATAWFPHSSPGHSEEEVISPLNGCRNLRPSP